jgi:hypothetical protein
LFFDLQGTAEFPERRPLKGGDPDLISVIQRDPVPGEGPRIEAGRWA